MGTEIKAFIHTVKPLKFELVGAVAFLHLEKFGLVKYCNLNTVHCIQNYFSYSVCANQ